MWYLAVRTARHRISALLAVAFAVLGAAALMTVTGVLAETGLRSHVTAGRLDGADLVVSADQSVAVPQDLPVALPERRTVPVALVTQVAHLPGVDAAVGDLSFPAAVIGAAGRVVPLADPATAGHGWASTVLLRQVSVDGTAPVGPAEVALDDGTAAAAGTRPGEVVRVVAAGRTIRAHVSAVVRNSGSTGIWFSDTRATELAGRDAGPRAGTVDLVGVRARPGAGPAVEAAVREVASGSGLLVSTGADRGDTTAPEVAVARSTLVLLAGSLAGVLLLVVGFVLAGALGVSVSGQRRELALMRSVGATPRQVRRLAAGQATITAAVALVPGVALGYLGSARLAHALVGYGLLPATLPLRVGPLPGAAAVLLLLLAVQVSARSAAWRTSRLPAVDALVESATERRAPSRVRAGAGALLIVAATALAVAPLLARSAESAAATSMSGILAAIGLALAGPALVRWAGAAAARRLSGRASTPTWLAVANTRGNATRAAGTVTSLAMAVLFVLTYVLSQTTVTAASSRQASDSTTADRTIAADSLGGLPAGLVAAVRAVPGVRAAVPVTTTTVLWPFRQMGDAALDSAPAQVLGPDAPAVLDLDVRDGDLAGLTGATVAVGADVARSRHVTVGARVPLVLGDGTPVVARVVAVYRRDLGAGPLVVSRDLAAGHTTNGLDQRLLVRTDGSAGVSRALAGLVAARPGVTLGTTAAASGGGQALSGQVWVNLALVVVLLAYLLLSVANRLVAATDQRRREIALLQLLGTTPRQVRATFRREAVSTALAAIVSGLVLSVIPLALLGTGFLGRPWPAGPAWLVPAVVATVGLVALLTVEVPTRRALRVPPTVALGRP